jgi:hypothetical protein
MYTWKCHKEIPCIVILNKKCHFPFFTKLENRREKQSYLGDWYQWERGECGDRI